MKMEAIRKFVRIPEDHRISIDIPFSIQTEQLVEVIIIAKENYNRQSKIENLKMAMKDPMYLQDLEETNNDFKYIVSCSMLFKRSSLSSFTTFKSSFEHNINTKQGLQSNHRNEIQVSE